MAGRQYSSANSSLASTTTASAAPQSSARFRTASMSSPPWPRAMATATTSPPEYAKMTRSDINQSPSTRPLLQVLDHDGQVGAGHRLACHHHDGVVTGGGADNV